MYRSRPHETVAALHPQMKAATNGRRTVAAAMLSFLAAVLHAVGPATAEFHTGDVVIIQQTQMNLTDQDCNVESVSLVVSPPPEQCSANVHATACNASVPLPALAAAPGNCL
jgi:hypothetical protein